MNVKQLIGLAAIVLGGMTSCSNILEEDGVSNIINKDETGELRISLLQDDAVSVSTKAETFADENYLIKITQGDTEKWTGKYQNAKSGIKLANGTYNVEAYNKVASEVSYFEWNAPYYKTTVAQSVTIENDTQTPTLTCYLANSIITIDTTNFDTDPSTKKLYVQSIKAKYNNSSIDLLDEEYPWTEHTMYVKAGIAATIELTVVRMNAGENSGKTLTFISPLKKTSESDDTAAAIDAKTKYNVQYTLNGDNGELTLTVMVNDDVQPKDILVDIDPYNPSTPSS